MGSDKYPPYMLAVGNVERILQKIKEARTPDRFTQDYLATALGFSGGGAKPFIPLAKRLGLLDSSGTPTELYRQFRNPGSSKAAMARAIKVAYDDLYRRNEYIHKLDKKSLEGLIAEATGLENGSSTLRAIAATFDSLKSFADFESTLNGQSTEKVEDKSDGVGMDEPLKPLGPPRGRELGIGLSAAIYINLPNTDDIAVFNAIFRSLRENLLEE